MADLFAMTAPLMARWPGQPGCVVAERIVAPGGLLVFEPFWHLAAGVDDRIHWLPGRVRGEGPWRIGKAVLTVLGCQDSHPALAAEFSRWQEYLQNHGPAYVSRNTMRAAARAKFEAVNASAGGI